MGARRFRCLERSQWRPKPMGRPGAGRSVRAQPPIRLEGGAFDPQEWQAGGRRPDRPPSADDAEPGIDAPPGS